MNWFEQVWSRVVPEQGVALSGTPVLIVLVAALVAVAVDPLWRVLRLGVTLVHELGHAGVGMLCGRRFTGFVLRGDMSGHAVTVGPARGFGRVLTTWAGYPAPGVVGAVVVWLAVRGWSAPVLTGILAVLVTAALRVRSGLTALVVGVALVGAGALWWAGPPQLQAQVVVAVGLVLIVGAWRHLGAVLGARRPRRQRPRGAGPADPGAARGLEHDLRRRPGLGLLARRGHRARRVRRPRLSSPTGVGSGHDDPLTRRCPVPDRSTYTSDEVESCRDNCDALLAAWGANDVEDSTLESLVFGQAVVVLHTWFGHRRRELEGDDGNPMNEVRVIADSIVDNDAVLRVEGPISWVPERTVLRLAVGDDVEVTANGFERLAAAYLAAIEATYPEAAG